MNEGPLNELRPVLDDSDLVPPFLVLIVKWERHSSCIAIISINLEQDAMGYQENTQANSWRTRKATLEKVMLQLRSEDV